MKHLHARRAAFTRSLGVFLDRIGVFFGTSLARWIVLGLFVVQALTLVFVTGLGTPPDEMNHMTFIDFYAHHSISPIFSHQTPTYYLGDKTREVDYLYHYAMSLVVRALPFLSSAVQYHVVRLFSVLFGLLTLLILARLFKRLGVSAAAITFGLLIVTNLPMVLMMSSAVNNDVMVWLGAALGMLLLVRLWQRPTALDVVWLFGVAVTGGLVKRTLMPLGVVFGLLAVIIVVRNWRALQKSVRFDWRMFLAVAVLLVGTGLFIERVGGNLVRYHTITPSCEKVQSVAACAPFWSNIRKQSLQALPPERQMSKPEFTVRWLGDSLVNVVDIQTQGWLHRVMPARIVTPLLGAFLLVGIIGAFVYEKTRLATDRLARQRLPILLIALYFLGVHLEVNYGAYKTTKFFGVALNGRYILPSLLPLTLLASFYWGCMLRSMPRLRVVLAAVVALVVIGGSGLTMMLRNHQLYQPAGPPAQACSGWIAGDTTTCATP